MPEEEPEHLDLSIRVFCRVWDRHLTPRTLIDDARSHGLDLRLSPPPIDPEPEEATDLDQEEWQLATFTTAEAKVDLLWQLAGDEAQAEENASFHRDIDAADVDDDTRAELHAVIDGGLGVLWIDAMRMPDLEVALAVADSYVRRLDGTLQVDEKGFLLGDRWVEIPELD